MASKLEARGSRGLIMRDFSAPALANNLEEAAHLMLETNPAAPRLNRAFITEHSPANFCNAILRSMA
jgi:hypothetical protein